MAWIGVAVSNSSLRSPTISYRQKSQGIYINIVQHYLQLQYCVHMNTDYITANSSTTIWARILRSLHAWQIKASFCLVSMHAMHIYILSSPMQGSYYIHTR